MMKIWMQLSGQTPIKAISIWSLIQSTWFLMSSTQTQCSKRMRWSYLGKLFTKQRWLSTAGFLSCVQRRWDCMKYYWKPKPASSRSTVFLGLLNNHVLSSYEFFSLLLNFPCLCLSSSVYDLVLSPSIIYGSDTIPKKKKKVKKCI